MVGYFGFCSCLLLLAVSQVVGLNRECHNSFLYDYHPDPYLYLKYEEALIKDHSQLEELRVDFITYLPQFVDLYVKNMSAVYVTNISCSSHNYTIHTDKPTFCVSQHTWGLCNDCVVEVNLEYKMKCRIDNEGLIFFSIVYVSLIHGSLTALY